MALTYDNKPLQWENEGVEPTAIQSSGFVAGYKPPAAYFNYHFSNTGKCLKELQEKLSAENDARKEAIKGITKASLGLDKVDNTADSEKNVAFASEAGVGRKVENSLIVRFEGGNEEGEDKWTFNGSTSKSINIAPDKIGAAKKDLSNVEEVSILARVHTGNLQKQLVAPAMAVDGINYQAPFTGVVDLYDGLEITIIPQITSESTNITLDIGSGGAKPVRLPYNFNTSAIGTPELPTFFGAGKPVKLRYSESAEVMISGQKIQGAWIAVDKPLVSAGYLTGILKPENGGAGVQADSTADLTAQLNKSLTVAANATDGINYSSTIEGITELYNGMEITIIPSMNNGTTAPKLNINGLGAVPIRRPLSTSTFVANAPEVNCMRANTPCRLMYHANYSTGGIWLMADKGKCSVTDLYGDLHTTVATTLKASKWSNGEYSFEADYLSDTYDIDLSLNGDSLTEEQKEAYSDAEIVGCSSSNKIKAFGTVPTIDIPIIIKAVRK